MKAKNFNDFNRLSESSSNESLYRSGIFNSYYRGNSKFSRWLRGIADDFSYKARDLAKVDRTTSGGDGGKGVLDQYQSIFPMLGNLAFSGIASIADFFTKPSNYKSPNFKVKRKEILDTWEEKNIKGKKIDQKDVESFYQSGVLRGKKYFGNDYDPANPKNKQESVYSDFLASALSRYYKKMNKD
jgi:hypothetical protein